MRRTLIATAFVAAITVAGASPALAAANPSGTGRPARTGVTWGPSPATRPPRQARPSTRVSAPAVCTTPRSRSTTSPVSRLACTDPPVCRQALKRRTPPRL